MKGLGRSFDRLVRGKSGDLDAFLGTVHSGERLDGTETLTYCHALLLNGNGIPRVRDLAEFVAHRVLEYAIPRSEIARAQEKDRLSNSTAEISRLKKKADGLFSGLKNTGEGGEVLLSILIQTVLRIPQLLCKMPLKTNPNVHYHGVDGIHADFDESTGTLAIYWGESKLYQKLSEATKDCLESVSKFLLGEGGSKDQKQRDLQLITTNLDLLDEKLEGALLNYLDKNHPSYNRLQYRAACLVGFDFASYPTRPNQVDLPQLLAEVERETHRWRKTIGKQVNDILNLNSFEIHFFMLPFPSVQVFRESFLSELGLT